MVMIGYNTMGSFLFGGGGGEANFMDYLEITVYLEEILEIFVST